MAATSMRDERYARKGISRSRLMSRMFSADKGSAFQSESRSRLSNGFSELVPPWPAKWKMEQDLKADRTSFLKVGGSLAIIFVELFVTSRIDWISSARSRDGPVQVYFPLQPEQGFVQSAEPGASNPSVGDCG